VDAAEQVADRGALLPHAAAASGRTAGGLAATGTGVTGRLAAAVAGSASGLAAAVASVAGRLAAAIAAATVLHLATLEQALQPAEQVALLPHAAAARTGTAGRLAATGTGVTGRLAAAVAGSASGLRTAVSGTTPGLAAAVAGVAAGLAARAAAALAQHPVEKLETERLATNGDAENQRTEENHTLHRATSPLLMDHARVSVPFANDRHPEVVIHELFRGRPVEPFRDSKDPQVTAAPWLPDGHSDAPGDRVGYRRRRAGGLSEFVPFFLG
jgi:hypothetical protein